MNYRREDRPVKWVRIAQFGNLLDANLTINALETRGIRAALVGEHQAAALGPIYDAAYGGPEVLVDESDEAEALAILAEIEQTQKDRRAMELPACPSCHGREVKRVLPRSRWIGMALFAVAAVVLSLGTPLAPYLGLAVILMGLYLMVCIELPRWICRKCSRSFSAPVPELPEEPEPDENPESP